MVATNLGVIVWYIAILLLLVSTVVAYVFVVIGAFRVKIWWGLVALIPLLGSAIFSLTHWSVAGTRFLLMVAGFLAYCAASFYFAGVYPEAFGPYVKKHPEFAKTIHLATGTVHSINQTLGGKAEDTKVAAAQNAATSEKLIDQRDELMQRQDAYDKHATDLNATYQRLQTERAAVKGTGPTLAAYNAKAAQYQDNVRSLAAEKAHIDALQQSVKAAEATLASTSAPKGPPHH